MVKPDKADNGVMKELNGSPPPPIGIEGMVGIVGMPIGIAGAEAGTVAAAPRSGEPTDE